MVWSHQPIWSWASPPIDRINNPIHQFWEQLSTGRVHRFANFSPFHSARGEDQPTTSHFLNRVVPRENHYCRLQRRLSGWGDILKGNASITNTQLSASN